MNAFESKIDSLPYSFDFNEMRILTFKTLLSFKEQMGYFQEFRSIGDDTFHYLIVFEVFGDYYIYSQYIENGKIETYQLEKIIDFDNAIAFVLAANVVNASPGFPFVKQALEKGCFFYKFDSGL